MYRLAYLCPYVTAAAMIVLFNDYEHWPTYLVLAAMCMLGIMAVVKGSNKDTEYRSGYSRQNIHPFHSNCVSGGGGRGRVWPDRLFQVPWRS